MFFFKFSSLLFSSELVVNNLCAWHFVLPSKTENCWEVEPDSRRGKFRDLCEFFFILFSLERHFSDNSTFSVFKLRLNSPNNLFSQFAVFNFPENYFEAENAAKTNNTVKWHLRNINFNLSLRKEERRKTLD